MRPRENTGGSVSGFVVTSAPALGTSIGSTPGKSCSPASKKRLCVSSC